MRSSLEQLMLVKPPPRGLDKVQSPARTTQPCSNLGKHQAIPKCAHAPSRQVARPQGCLLLGIRQPKQAASQGVALLNGGLDLRRAWWVKLGTRMNECGGRSTRMWSASQERRAEAHKYHG